ncbi:hypothetical protein FQA39_LY00881 [Lamprigera yunnana]|nr:hypothetical protein FQA39_LY00881 [Lamprigera yunnana]
MNSKSIKVRSGVKTFLDKAKSRSVPLHLGAIMTFDTDSCENNTVDSGKVEQSIDLPWSIPDDYDANNEACLLRYGKAAEETLINSTRYDLDNKDPMRNGDNFIKTITLQRDYCTCTFNRYDVEAIFHLKPIINYRSEIMRSSGFKEFYDNIVECVKIAGNCTTITTTTYMYTHLHVHAAGGNRKQQHIAYNFTPVIGHDYRPCN